MRRYLVLGNQTLTSTELLDELRARAVAEPSTFHLVVPMRHPAGAWSEGSAHAATKARMTEAMERLRDAGLKVTGAVGDANPVAAVSDAVLASSTFDEIIVSTLPAGISHWLGQDVPRRVAHEHPRIAVAHVVSEPAHAF